jgi:hypothetical protein
MRLRKEYGPRRMKRGKRISDGWWGGGGEVRGAEGALHVHVAAGGDEGGVAAPSARERDVEAVEAGAVDAGVRGRGLVPVGVRVGVGLADAPHAAGDDHDAAAAGGSEHRRQVRARLRRALEGEGDGGVDFADGGRQAELVHVVAAPAEDLERVRVAPRGGAFCFCKNK